MDDAERDLSASISSAQLDSTMSSDSEDFERAGLRRPLGVGKRQDKSHDSTSSPLRSVPNQASTSPARSQSHPYSHMPASPSRNLYSGSPRLSSPSGSQIFERDVQEATVLPVPNSPAIPSHIHSENYIPPVLDASSEAITDNQLDPDTVEIVMHTAHHPASLAVTGMQSSDLSSSWPEELVSAPDKDDSASNYGNLDSPDVRRLSFISFADVVQAEQAEQVPRDSISIAGLRPLSPSNRSPSPIRSPISSQGADISPPRSKTTSIKGVELSPARVGRPLGSPTGNFSLSPASGELTIETMTQALKKTRSGDLSGVRSQPMSPVSLEGPEGAFH